MYLVRDEYQEHLETHNEQVEREQLEFRRNIIESNEVQDNCPPLGRPLRRMRVDTECIDDGNKPEPHAQRPRGVCVKISWSDALLLHEVAAK